MDPGLPSAFSLVRAAEKYPGLPISEDSSIVMLITSWVAQGESLSCPVDGQFCLQRV